MKPVAIIVSLNFNPGHVSHLIASYKQMEELGYSSVYYVNPLFTKFLPDNVRIRTSDFKIPKCDVAVITFPSLHNLPLIQRLRNQRTKIIYIFHEPLAPLSHYRASGFSYKYLVKLWIIDHINSLTVKWSDCILIPSKKALDYYQKNHKYKNPNVQYIPLLYDDEALNAKPCNRQYISYIGTVAADHSFDEFVNYVNIALSHNWHNGYYFLIATKSEFDIPDVLKESSRVKILKGKPLTNEEINQAYGGSAVVWNAYARTTQSGVLAKAYMFGTPAIVMHNNLNEFMIEGQTVVSISNNQDADQIHNAIDSILPKLDEFVKNCREMFLDKFYYRKYNKDIQCIL